MTSIGALVLFIPPVDDQLTMAPPPFSSVVRSACSYQQHTAQVDRQDPVELAEGDVGEGFHAGDSRHVEDGIDLTEGFDRAAANIASTSSSFVTSTWNGTKSVTQVVHRGGDRHQ